MKDPEELRRVVRTLNPIDQLGLLLVRLLAFEGLSQMSTTTAKDIRQVKENHPALQIVVQLCPTIKEVGQFAQQA